MKVSFICPFSLDRPTGTPSRARTTIRSASGFTETSVVTLLMSSVPEGITVKSVGICGLIPFTRRALRELQVIHPEFADNPYPLFFSISGWCIHEQKLYLRCTGGRGSRCEGQGVFS